MARWWIAAVVLLAIIVAVVIARSDDEIAARRTPSVHRDSGSTQTIDVPTPGATDLPATESRVLERDVVAAKPVEPETPPFVQDAGIDLSGAVVVTDANGTAHDHEDGTITVEVCHRGERSRLVIWVTNGRFANRIASDTEEIEIDKVVLADRPAIPEHTRLSAPFTGVILRTTWPRSTTLRVLDAETQADLADLTVASWSGYDDLQHPGELKSSQVKVEGVPSPLAMTPPQQDASVSWEENLFVHAPGHAWGRVHLDYQQGGETVLKLPRSAELEVTLHNEAALEPYRRENADPSLCLHERDVDKIVADRLRDSVGMIEADFADGHRPTEADIRAEIEAGEKSGERVLGDIYVQVKLNDHGPTVVRDLAPGSYLVTVESFCTLGEVPVDLRAGDHAAVTIVLADPPAPRDKVPLAGTVFIPPAWQVEAFGVELMRWPDGGDRDPAAFREIKIPYEQLTPIATSPGWYRWDAGTAAIGEYFVSVETPQFSCAETFTLSSSGRDDVRLVLKEPADVRVRVVDKGSRDPRQVTSVRTSWFLNRDADWDPTTGTYHLRVLAETTTIKVNDRDRCFEKTVELKPGLNEVTVEIPDACGIVLWRHDGNSRVPWPNDLWIHVQDMAAPDERVTSSCGDSGLPRRIEVTRAGRYQVIVPDIDGCLPIPPFEVEVLPGQFTEHEVRTTPAR